MRLHHVAYTTADIDKKAAELASLFGFKTVAAPLIDPVQRVRLVFMDMGDGSLIELLEPHGGKGPVVSHLKKGGGLYHMCFEVSDLEGTLQRLRDTGDVHVVCEPVPAVAFDNRRVAFVVNGAGDLVEFLEEKKA